ncbi:hypothetical protein ACS0TY_023271 [Phlomoides rotata]
MALEIADRICRSGAVDLICIDSVSALTPPAEIEVLYITIVKMFLKLIDLILFLKDKYLLA